VSILQCKIFTSYRNYNIEHDFNAWCKENNIGPYDIKDIKYKGEREDYSIFVLYSKEIESNNTITEDPNKYFMYTGTPN
jgi:hypothetical protein